MIPRHVIQVRSYVCGSWNAEWSTLSIDQTHHSPRRPAALVSMRNPVRELINCQTANFAIGLEA